jgi:hypothetical protein
MMASVLLAIAVVGIAGPLGAASTQSRLGQERGTAVGLARELMEEIAAKPLVDSGTVKGIGPESAQGETDRSKFDAANDYNGYTDSTTGLKNLAGGTVAFPASATYTRSVAFEFRASPNGVAVGSGDYGVVTVTVTTPHKQSVKVSRLLTNVVMAY